MITTLPYSNAPPVPIQIVDAQGSIVFSGDDIITGLAARERDAQRL